MFDGVNACSNCTFHSFSAMAVSCYFKTIVFCSRYNGTNFFFGEHGTLSICTHAQYATRCGYFYNITSFFVTLTNSFVGIFFAVDYTFFGTRIAHQIRTITVSRISMSTCCSNRFSCSINSWSNYSSILNGFSKSNVYTTTTKVSDCCKTCHQILFSIL